MTSDDIDFPFVAGGALRGHGAVVRVLIGCLLACSVACEDEAIEEVELPPPPVHVERVVPAEWTPRAEGVAPLDAVRDATLRAETAGRVVRVEVERGERVEVGQVLLKLDVGRAATALRAATAQVEQTEARVAQAERQAELAARLAESGGIPQQELENAEDTLRLARAARDAARAQTGVTRRGLAEAVVRAPFDGVVVERLVEVGEFVAPGAPVLHLVDRSSLRARVLLDPRRALDVRPGAPVEVEVHARPEERFGGQVLRIGEVVDPRTRRLPVEVQIDDPEQRLRPGLVARFSVQTGDPAQALSVPTDALFERFGETQVFVIRDGRAARTAVTLGESRGDRVRVEGGLEEGDVIVVAGLDRVVHEREVNVVERVADGS